MISYMILEMIFLCPAAADPRPAQCADETDDDHEPDRAIYIDEERDFAGQSPHTDMDDGYGGRCRDARTSVEAHALLH